MAAANDLILASAATLSEPVSTMERSKFDRYASRASRRDFVAFVHANVQFVSIRRSVQACGDPNDDKFLDVAVNGGAAILITGDADLLALNPYEGIPILTAANYLPKIGG